MMGPWPEAGLARLRGMGILDPEDDPSVLIEAPGVRPRFFFQLAPEQKTVKNRVHLDLACDSLADELERLRELGATLVAEYADHLLLRESNPPCVIQRGLFCPERPGVTAACAMIAKTF